jgi:Tfp pilus assembly protein PilV
VIPARMSVVDRVRAKGPRLDAEGARFATEGGFTMIEVIVALSVLIVGILGAYIAFVTSQRLSLVSERHATMTQIAQKEIERLQGIPYSDLALTSAPTTSTDPTNPDYYVVPGTTPSYKWNRSGTVSEPVAIDSIEGTVAPVSSWTEGSLTGQVYDFVTWTTDTQCSPSCPTSQDYKRITVAVTMSNGLLPTPVYVSTVLADPKATPPGGCGGGTCGNPLLDPTSTCQNASGQRVACTVGIDQGVANTWFLHNCAATNSSCAAPGSNSATNATSGPVLGQLCTASQTLAAILANIVGCPTPDLMDDSPPAGTVSTPLYNYSTDQCSVNCSSPGGTTNQCSSNCTYPGGRLLQPTCSSGLCGGGPIGVGGTGPTGSGGGTASTSDCTSGWSNGYLNVQSELWASPPLATSLTLTGSGGLTIFTQTLGGVAASVSLCVEIYDLPPSGSAGSTKDILAWPPVDLGGAADVPATDPATGSNWPEALGELSFDFNFRGSAGVVTVPAGDRIAARVWMKSSVNVPVAVVYDNPSYPAQLQLNSR